MLSEILEIYCYEFIDQKEFDRRKTDSKYSFIILMDGLMIRIRVE